MIKSEARRLVLFYTLNRHTKSSENKKKLYKLNTIVER